MRKYIYLISIILITLTGVGNAKNTDFTVQNQDIDAYVNTIIKRYEIPGLAIAVLKNKKLIYKQYHGRANIEHDVPVTGKTIFKTHSLSKIFTATSFFKLVEEGKVSLEDKISKYYDGLPDTWRSIKIINLLTHSSGLPDIVRYADLKEEDAKAKVFSDKIRFSPGERFDYNQTNFWLINRIIEKITSSSLDEYVLKHQFGLNKKSALFSSSDNELVMNRVSEYFANRDGVLEVDHFKVPEYLFGAAGLNLTLDEFVQWNNKFNANQYIKEATKKDMWTAFNFSNSDTFSNGWALYPIKESISYGFSGGNNIAAYRRFEDAELSVIFLANGFRYGFDVSQIINHIAGISLKEFAGSKSSLQESLFASFIDNDFDAGQKRYKQLKKNNDKSGLSNQLNTIGYLLLARKRVEEAIQVFSFNVKENPNEWNLFDSLAEGYEIKGDIKNAIANYKKVLGMNENNQRARSKIKELEGN